MKRTRLSDNFSIFCDDPKAARILFNQIKGYLKYGIDVQVGDIVFDVGANIGLFSSWIHHQLQGRVSVYAFEPIPIIFNILQENSRYFSQIGQPIRVYNYALLNKNGIVSFSYYPNASALSSISPYNAIDKMMFIDAIKSNLNTGPFEVRILEFLPSCIRNILIEKEVNRMLESSYIQCRTKTLSEVIKDEKINRIDLLKIDVEKSEMKVVDGILDEDWRIIRQVAIEVHDYSGQLLRLKSILKSKEFKHVFVDQDDMLQGSNIYSVLARK